MTMSRQAIAAEVRVSDEARQMIRDAGFTGELRVLSSGSGRAEGSVRVRIRPATGAQRWSGVVLSVLFTIVESLPGGSVVNYKFDHEQSITFDYRRRR